MSSVKRFFSGTYWFTFRSLIYVGWYSALFVLVMTNLGSFIISDIGIMFVLAMLDVGLVVDQMDNFG